jgi:hypothetical protein
VLLSRNDAVVFHAGIQALRGIELPFALGAAFCFDHVNAFERLDGFGGTNGFAVTTSSTDISINS